jgi:hypothetical protein
MKTFKDVKFKQHQLGAGSIQGLLMLENGTELSIVAGPGMYCTPKANGEGPEDFSSFEVAVFDKEGEMNEDPKGWQSRGDINTLILQLNG